MSISTPIKSDQSEVNDSEKGGEKLPVYGELKLKTKTCEPNPRLGSKNGLQFGLEWSNAETPSIG